MILTRRIYTNRGNEAEVDERRATDTREVAVIGRNKEDCSYKSM